MRQTENSSKVSRNQDPNILRTALSHPATTQPPKVKVKMVQGAKKYQTIQTSGSYKKLISEVPLSSERKSATAT
jgi:hypothetical protein